MSSFVACPSCRQPALITDRFTLSSTDGPVEHVAIDCVAHHGYRMPIDMLDRAVNDVAAPMARLPGGNIDGPARTCTVAGIETPERA